MMRKGKLKDIAKSLIEHFISRNNDFGGYWALGFLYQKALKEGKKSLSINLLRGEVDLVSVDLDRIAQVFRTHLKRHARLRSVSYVDLGSAVITVSFNDDRGTTKIRSSSGDPFVCEITLSDTVGESVSLRRTGYCWSNNSKCQKRARTDELETLGIGGDDDIEILEDIEKVFQIKISDEDAAACCTVGDIYELLLMKYDLVATERMNHVCADDLAFNDVRRVIGKLTPIDVKPDMLLSDFGFSSDGVVRDALQRELPVAIPKFVMTWNAVIIWILGFFGSIYLIAGLGLPWILATLSVIWLIMAPRFLPVMYDGTVGEFVKHIASLNPVYYCDQGASVDAGTVWDSLVTICKDYCRFTRKRITSTTFVLALK